MSQPQLPNMIAMPPYGTNPTKSLTKPNRVSDNKYWGRKMVDGPQCDWKKANGQVKCLAGRLFNQLEGIHQWLS